MDGKLYSADFGKDIKDKPGKSNLRLSRRDMAMLILQLLSFFVARASIFGMLNPLGIAYISIWLGEGRGFYLGAALACLGFATGATFPYTWKYFFCVGILCGLNWLAKRSHILEKPMMKPLASGLAMMVSAVIGAWFISSGIYGILMGLLEGVLVFALGYIFLQGVNCITAEKIRGSLNNEEMVSIALIAAGVAAGCADIHIWQISLRYSSCLIIIALLARSGGVGVGAVTGLLLGLLMNLTGYETLEFAIILSIGGLAGGLLRNQWRPFNYLAQMAAVMVSAVFLDLSLINMELCISALLAGVLFCVIPDRFILNIYAISAPATERGQDYQNKVKELAVGRLKKLGYAVSRLVGAYEQLPHKKEGLSNNEVNSMIDDIAAQVCQKCRKCDECWQDGFYDTYSNVFAVLGRLDNKDNPAAIESDIDQFCIRPQEFLNSASRCFELYRTSLTWQNRVLESRIVAFKQLTGISGTILQLAEDLEHDLEFDTELENRLLAELNKNKIEVESVIVLENRLGRLEVDFGQRYEMRTKQQDTDILEILSRVLGSKMKKDEDAVFYDNSGRRVSRIHYVEDYPLRISCGAARSVKSGGKDSGDSYSFMELKDGRCLLALSDGMGSGRRAKEESSAAIELLEDFAALGFEQKNAIELINSSLLLKSGGESFSTLDIVSVDLESGQAEFVKIGAASSILLREGGVEVIRSWTLPAGIVNEVEAEASRRRLQDGDIIVMMSDGILDSKADCEDKEAWAVHCIKQLGSHNPQEIADHLLSEATANYGGQTKDDMTVLVARVWEKRA